VETIGFGGSCPWCTEAIFLSVKGVSHVAQGWIAPADDLSLFSEAVVVTFDPAAISLAQLVSVHLHSHSCTANHRMRSKYPSAVYLTDSGQWVTVRNAIAHEQAYFAEQVITRIIPFGQFRLNTEEYLDYYYRDPSKPFCENIVNPKLRDLIRRFNDLVDTSRLAHLGKAEREQ
jgi:peptide-methionine (S)-S-oxide reductase